MKKILLILFTLLFFTAANAIDAGNNSTSGMDTGIGTPNSAANPKDTGNENCNNDAPGTENDNGSTNPDNTGKDKGIEVKTDH